MSAVEEFDFDLAQGRRAPAARLRGSELAARAFHRAFEADPGARGESVDTSRTPARGAGRRTRRSTQRCRLPAISAALFARFASRQEESLAAKVNAALRAQFGGHAVEAAKMARRRPNDAGNRRREPAGRRHAEAAPSRSRVDLRRLGRPDAAQADAGAVPAGLPAPAAGPLRDRGRLANRDDDRRVPRADAAGDPRAQRRVPRRRLGGAGREPLLRDGRLRRRGRGAAADRPSGRPRRDARNRRQPRLLPGRPRRPSVLSSPRWAGRAARRLDAAGSSRSQFGHDRWAPARSTTCSTSTSRRTRSTASTTTWARRWSRTCSSCGSPTDLRADLEPAVHRPRADHGGRTALVEGRGDFYDVTGPCTLVRTTRPSSLPLRR